MKSACFEINFYDRSESSTMCSYELQPLVVFKNSSA